MEEIKVKCLSCGKEVVIKPQPYGGGQIAVCPSCGQLALNK